MSEKWLDDEISLLESLRPCCTTVEIKDIFQNIGCERSVEALLKKSRQIGVTFKELDMPSIPENLNHIREEVEKYLNQVRYQHLSCIAPPTILSPSEKAATTMARRKFINSQMEQLEEIRESVPRTSSMSFKKASGSKESLAVIISDIHVGRKFNNLDGQTLYNIDIGLQRIQATAGNALNQISNKLSNIDEVVLLIIGDIVDGEGIFPFQEMQLETHAAEQVNKVTKSLWKMVMEFKNNFPLCRIVTTKGNHGRSGVSPESNWDNMIYQQLELLVDMHNDPNLTIKNRYGDYNTVVIKGWKGLLRHRAPVQSDTGGAIAKYAGWYGIHQWDFFCFGHFHHWGVGTWQGKPILRNGSLMGGDDYAEGFGYYDDPTQLMFGVNEDTTPPSFIVPIRY